MANGKSKFAEAFEAQEAAEQFAAKRQKLRRSVPEIDSRRAGRMDHTEPADLLTTAGVRLATVHNLSVIGALVSQYQGEVLEVGETLSLRLFDGRHLLARVTRADGRYLGLTFDDQLGSLDDILHFEARGPSFYRALVRRPTEPHS